MRKPDVGDAAPDVTLVAKTGRQVTLSARWKRAPLVAVFLRHFG